MVDIQSDVRDRGWGVSWCGTFDLDKCSKETQLIKAELR